MDAATNSVTALDTQVQTHWSGDVPALAPRIRAPDASLLILGFATAVASPPVFLSETPPTNTAVEIVVEGARSIRASKSVTEEDLVLDSPTWLKNRIQSLKVRGFRRWNR